MPPAAGKTNDGGTDPGVGGFVVRAYSAAGTSLTAAESAAAPAASDITAAYGTFTLLNSFPTRRSSDLVQSSPWIESKPTGNACATGAPTLADGGYAETLVSNQTKAGEIGREHV